MEAEFERLLRRFPKIRPPLPPEYKSIFLNEYLQNRKGGSAAAYLATYLERWMHRQAARSPALFPLLEIGAGTLNHIPYEPTTGRYDAVEPWNELYAAAPARSRLHQVYPSIYDIPATERYPRIVSIAVMEHVLDLPMLLARCGRLLDDAGALRFGIPSEGAALWYAAWRYGTGTSFRLRTGLDYAAIMRHEHINTAREILALTRMVFSNVSVRHFPLPVFAASLYTFVEARAPALERIVRIERYYG